MKKIILSFTQKVDFLSEITGKGISWLLVIMVVITTYDTIARYVFNKATIWAFDASYMLFGTYFMIGSSWTLKKEGHVSIDILSNKLSKRKQAWLTVFFDLTLFFPFTIAGIIYGGKYALKSWEILEKSWQSVWYPPLYPFKTVIPVAFMLLFLQGFSIFLKNILMLIENKN